MIRSFVNDATLTISEQCLQHTFALEHSREEVTCLASALSTSHVRRGPPAAPPSHSTERRRRVVACLVACFVHRAEHLTLSHNACTSCFHSSRASHYNSCDSFGCKRRRACAAPWRRCSTRVAGAHIPVAVFQGDHDGEMPCYPVCLQTGVSSSATHFLLPAPLNANCVWWFARAGGFQAVGKACSSRRR